MYSSVCECAFSESHIVNALHAATHVDITIQFNCILQNVITKGRGSDMMAIEHKRILNNKHNELCEEMMPHFLLPTLEKKG
mgnify:CR=1 FL=1